MSELITCPACGAKVSSAARYCVNCGETSPGDNCAERYEKEKEEAEDKERRFEAYKKLRGEERALEWAARENIIKLESITASEVKKGDTIKSPYGSYGLHEIERIDHMQDGTLEFSSRTHHFSRITPNQKIVLYIENF